MPAGMTGTPVTGQVTVGSLEQMILMDNTIQQWEKQQALARLKRDLAYASSDTILTREMLMKLGGGALGAMIAKYLGMGMLGMTVAGLAGYGIGKVVSDFYKPANMVRWIV